MANLSNPTARRYTETVETFIKTLPSDKKNSLFILDPRDITKEFEAWMYYFVHHLQWLPYALFTAIRGTTKFYTVPTQWPEWLDLKYVPPAKVYIDKSALEKFMNRGSEPAVDIERSNYDELTRMGTIRPVGRFEK